MPDKLPDTNQDDQNLAQKVFGFGTDLATGLASDAKDYVTGYPGRVANAKSPRYKGGPKALEVTGDILTKAQAAVDPFVAVTGGIPKGAGALATKAVTGTVFNSETEKTVSSYLSKIASMGDANVIKTMVQRFNWPAEVAKDELKNYKQGAKAFKDWLSKNHAGSGDGYQAWLDSGHPSVNKHGSKLVTSWRNIHEALGSSQENVTPEALHALQK